MLPEECLKVTAPPDSKKEDNIWISGKKGLTNFSEGKPQGNEGETCRDAGGPVYYAKESAGEGHAGCLLVRQKVKIGEIQSRFGQAISQGIYFRDHLGVDGRITPGEESFLI